MIKSYFYQPNGIPLLKLISHDVLADVTHILRLDVIDAEKVPTETIL